MKWRSSIQPAGDMPYGGGANVRHNRLPSNVTTLPEQETRLSQGSGGRYCEGCPRCRDADAGFCTSRHPQYNNLHPVCRRCGHCVLRGSHSDDTSDLEGG